MIFNTHFSVFWLVNEESCCLIVMIAENDGAMYRDVNTFHNFKILTAVKTSVLIL
jgi:hypothetical protein